MCLYEVKLSFSSKRFKVPGVFLLLMMQVDMNYVTSRICLPFSRLSLPERQRILRSHKAPAGEKRGCEIFCVSGQIEASEHHQVCMWEQTSFPSEAA